MTAVPGDITTDEGRQAALRACASPDILVNNAGGPPPGDFRDWDRETWIKALEANMIAPILMTIVALVFSDKFALKWGPVPVVLGVVAYFVFPIVKKWVAA